MIVPVLLAFVNGMFIGTSRSINGRLSTEVGPRKASLWNHAVGFAFLSGLLLVAGHGPFDPAGAPLLAYLGGCIGALYVVVNNSVFLRLGAMNAALAVISGQMLSAVLIDYLSASRSPGLGQILGVVIILAGIYLTRTRSKGKP